MNTKLNNLICFAIGVTVGSLITHKLIRDKYKRFADEEIEAVRDVYMNSNKEKNSEEDISDDISDEEESDEYLDEEDYGKIIRDNGYSYVDEETSSEDLGVLDIEDGPHIIEPGEWGMHTENDMMVLRYFANGVLTDDWEIPVDDPMDMVGPDILEEFNKDPELDVLYVRNNERKEDYEIVRELIDYEENEGDIFE